jgi:RNA polymerase sigma factor (sigma-70 family)
VRWRRQTPADSVTEHSSDVELLRSVAAEDMGALRQLYLRHAPWIRLRLARRCADPDVVDAAVQDTFVAVWRDARNYSQGGGEAAAWIWTIAIRRLVSTLRGPGHRWVSGIAGQAGDWDARQGENRETVPSAEDLVLLRIEHGDLGAALDRLSPELRAVIQATALDGLTVREAASLLGVAEGTAKTRLMRARARLRELLA